jgi:hypothetical protein
MRKGIIVSCTVQSKEHHVGCACCISHGLLRMNTTAKKYTIKLKHGWEGGCSVVRVCASTKNFTGIESKKVCIQLIVSGMIISKRAWLLANPMRKASHGTVHVKGMCCASLFG